MARVLAVGVYLADRPNTAAHVTYEMAASIEHDITLRWIALAPDGKGRFDLPATEMVITERTPKFELLDFLSEDAFDYDWLIYFDDDIELPPGLVDTLLRYSTRYDFALSQPARTADSYIDHPIVQVMPGLAARRTRFVEIGPLVCIRRDAMPLLLPAGEYGMGWGLDFVWPVRMEQAGLRVGIVDAAPVAHRIRPPVSSYDFAAAFETMSWTLARNAFLTSDEAFTVLEAFP